jgi:hypothetical protein
VRLLLVSGETWASAQTLFSSEWPRRFYTT